MRPMRAHFALEPGLTFLNHGSFGACPTAVLEHQTVLRRRLEAEPVRFLMRELEPLQDAAREALGRFVGARPDDLAFVTNATTAVNTVLRSLSFAPGDELLTTTHGYNACTNALRYVAERSGATVVQAAVPFPLARPEDAAAAVRAAVTPRTRVALLDHVTSPTGLVLPVAELTRELEARGVMVMLDGAHAPGMLDLDLTALGASFATGNLHKWVCAPKGAGFLHVRADRQPLVRPLVISHGANSPRTDRSRFRLEFDWLGTGDPTPWLCVPKALEVVGALEPGGWPEVRAKNRALAIEARRLLLRALGTAAPAPESMLGSMAAVILPSAATGPGALPGTNLIDPVQDRLFREHRIEVPVFTFGPHRCLRISAQRYNTLADFERLAAALPRALC